MQKEIQNLINKVNTTGAHIFYYFHDQDRYINNLIAYVTSSLELGNHVMIIENDRYMPIIQEKINKQFNEEQKDMIHTINNYDFYCYGGNFHKETILKYLKDMIAPYLEKKLPIKTWAHVEWRDQKEIFHTLGENDHEADPMLQEADFTSICAYDANRVPQTLKNILIDCHDYYMTDDSICKITRNKVKAE